MASTDRPLAQGEPYIEDVCEQLFLLEVLVDKIDIKTEGLLGAIEKKVEIVEEEVEEEEEEEDDEEEDDEAKWLKELERRRKKRKKVTRPIKVKVKFFDFPTIEIDEWDFTEAKEERARQMDLLKDDLDSEEEEELADEEGLTVEEWREKRERQRKLLAEELAESMPPGDNFCSGKSCLFPMVPLDLVNAIKKSPLQVQVNRAGDAEQAPRVIGRTSIQLGDNFVEAIALASSPSVLPVSAFIDGPYPLRNVFGELTATVYIYVRISCFGNSIFTQFKLKEGEDDYLFKMSGRKLAPAERLAEQLRKGKKIQDYLPKLIPIITRIEDFTVGVKAPVMHPIEQNLKLPINWRKRDDLPPIFKMCAPEKLCKKPMSEPKYRKNISDLQRLLDQIIPGFGRQVGDPDFIKNNPTIPRYCEMKRDGKAENSENNEISVENRCDLFTNGEPVDPGTKLSCQYGTNWSPITFPLPRQDMFPPLDSLTAKSESSFFNSKSNALDKGISERKTLSNSKHVIISNTDKKLKLLCTCKKILKGIQQTNYKCDCCTNVPSKYLNSSDIKTSSEETETQRERQPLQAEPISSETISFGAASDSSKDDEPMIFMFTADDNYYNGNDKDRNAAEQKKKKYKENDSNLEFQTIKTYHKQKKENEIKNNGLKQPKEKNKIINLDSKIQKINKKYKKNALTRRICANPLCKCPCEKVYSKNKKQNISDHEYLSDNKTDSEFMEQIESDKASLKNKMIENYEIMQTHLKHQQRLEKAKRQEELRKINGLETNTVASSSYGAESPISTSEQYRVSDETLITDTSEQKRIITQDVKNLLKVRGMPIEVIADINSKRGKLYDDWVNKKKAKTAKRKIQSIQYVYTNGLYPGYNIGHQNCIPEHQREQKTPMKTLCPMLYKQYECNNDDDSADYKMKNKTKEMKDSNTENESDESEESTEESETDEDDVDGDEDKGDQDEEVEGKEKQGEEKQGKEKQGKEKQGEEKQGKEKQGKEKQGEEKQGEEKQGDEKEEEINEEEEKIAENYLSLLDGSYQLSPTLHIHKTKGLYRVVMYPEDPIRNETAAYIERKKQDRVVFTFNTKQDGSVTDGENASDHSSTASEDSMVLDYTSPMDLLKLIPPKLQHSLAIQTEDEKADVSTTSQIKQSDIETDVLDKPKPKPKFLPRQHHRAIVKSDEKKRSYAEKHHKQSSTHEKHVLIKNPPMYDEPLRLHAPPPLSVQPKTTILKQSKYYDQKRHR